MHDISTLKNPSLLFAGLLNVYRDIGLADLDVADEEIIQQNILVIQELVKSPHNRSIPFILTNSTVSLLSKQNSVRLTGNNSSLLFKIKTILSTESFYMSLDKDNEQKIKLIKFHKNNIKDIASYEYVYITLDEFLVLLKDLLLNELFTIINNSFKQTNTMDFFSFEDFIALPASTRRQYINLYHMNTI